MICEVCGRERGALNKYGSSTVDTTVDQCCWREFTGEQLQRAQCLQIGYERERAAREKAEAALRESEARSNSDHARFREQCEHQWQRAEKAEAALRELVSLYDQEVVYQFGSPLITRARAILDAASAKESK